MNERLSFHKGKIILVNVKGFTISFIQLNLTYDLWFNIKHSISLSIFRWYIGEFQIWIAEYNQGIYSLILLQADAIIDGKTMNVRSEWKTAQPFEQDGKNVKQNFIFLSNHNSNETTLKN